MNYKIASLKRLKEEGQNIERLPFSIRILLENALRNHDGFAITDEHLDTLTHWIPSGTDKDIPFKPARVLMQDFTGVPAVVDITSIRAEVVRKGGDGSKINPAIPVDLVIDHSVQVDYFGAGSAYEKNVALEYKRNAERYKLLKWAQNGLDNFTVVPPGMGICHQVNLEYLAKGVVERDGWAFPDTLVGTDSHTPMVNGIGVLAWGVGGIEAEAAMLGQPIYFTCPQVIGLKLTGNIPPGCTATDMALTITKLLRDTGVVGKFVEVFGDGLSNLTVTDRATISNMSPEFGCTVTYFPIDDQTLEYMARTNRSQGQIDLVREYSQENMLWRTGEDKIEYSQVVELNLDTLEPTVSGPKRPQDKILVKHLAEQFPDLIRNEFDRTYIPYQNREAGGWHNPAPTGAETGLAESPLRTVSIDSPEGSYNLSDGSIVIAAITSCTNTSNPAVMVGAGLVARKAVEKGLRTQPWVKTSLAPGSKVVTKYLDRSGLSADLEKLRFHTVGYGCTSCIGNSGPLEQPIADAVEENDLLVASVLSGNRNFEARVHPQVKMNFLMSPMLVVAYSLVGRVDINLLEEPLGHADSGEPVYLKDIWPTQEEINNTIVQAMKKEDFEEVYDVIFDGEEQWKSLDVPTGKEYAWEDSSTYIREVPFFQNISVEPQGLNDIMDARVLLMLGDSVTTDHISPAGSFNEHSAAGQYLIDQGINIKDFNSYGSRRGNHEVMMRGTFANVRIKNRITDKVGGFSTHFPSNETLTVFETAMRYQESGTPLIVLAGKEYGSGSSRDWAAKGPNLLGVKAVIAESFERIHRSNLVGMGILPLQYMNGETADTLALSGKEHFTIEGIGQDLAPFKTIRVKARKESGETIEFDTRARLDSAIDVEYFKHGGILHYVLRSHLKK